MNLTDLPIKHSVPWTDEEIQDAIHLHKSGLTWAQVADELGRTEHAVIAVMRHRGATPKRAWTEEEQAQALAWRAEGLSNAEIGERLNRTTMSVATKLNLVLRDQSNPRVTGPNGVPGWGPFLKWHSTF